MVKIAGSGGPVLIQNDCCLSNLYWIFSHLSSIFISPCCYFILHLIPVYLLSHRFQSGMTESLVAIQITVLATESRLCKRYIIQHSRTLSNTHYPVIRKHYWGRITKPWNCAVQTSRECSNIQNTHVQEDIRSMSPDHKTCSEVGDLRLHQDRETQVIQERGLQFWCRGPDCFPTSPLELLDLRKIKTLASKASRRSLDSRRWEVVKLNHGM